MIRYIKIGGEQQPVMRETSASGSKGGWGWKIETPDTEWTILFDIPHGEGLRGITSIELKRINGIDGVCEVTVDNGDVYNSETGKRRVVFYDMQALPNMDRLAHELNLARESKTARTIEIDGKTYSVITKQQHDGPFFRIILSEDETYVACATHERLAEIPAYVIHDDPNKGGGDGLYIYSDGFRCRSKGAMQVHSADDKAAIRAELELKAKGDSGEPKTKPVYVFSNSFKTLSHRGKKFDAIGKIGKITSVLAYLHSKRGEWVQWSFLQSKKGFDFTSSNPGEFFKDHPKMLKNILQHEVCSSANANKDYRIRMKPDVANE